MQSDHSFERQLKNLEHESNVIANYVYAEMALQHAASKSPKLLSRMNMTPTFWNACNAAFQSAAYIALGRVFDTKNSRYSIEELLKSVEKEIHLFQRPALEKRKRDGFQGDLSWLSGYLDKAHYLNLKDVAHLRKKVANTERYTKKLSCLFVTSTLLIAPLTTTAQFKRCTRKAKSKRCGACRRS